MKRRVTFALGLLTAPALFAQGPVIDHAGVGCIVADRHPRIEARVTPAESVARARVYFRASGTSAWYFVLMKRLVHFRNLAGQRHDHPAALSRSKR